MKIAIVSNAPESLIRFRGPLLALLAKRGHEVATLAPAYSDEQRVQLESIGVSTYSYRVERTGTSAVADLITLTDLYRWFARERPDACLTYFMKPNMYGSLAGLAAGVPRRFGLVEGLGYLFTLQDNEPLRRRLIRGFAVQVLRLGLGRATGVMFLNPDDRAEFIARGIVRPERTHLLGGIGVELDKFTPVPLPSGPPRFLMIGRLLREKGVCEYLEACKRVKVRFPEAQFHLVGGADTNPGAIPLATLRTMIRDAGAMWPGEVADIASRIADSSVFVLPSYREGVPRSTQEAMAMGRAVITTDVPGCRETVIQDVNGFLVPVRDVEALAAAMAQFCEQPELMTAMGLASRAIAEGRFDVNKINARIYNLLIGTNDE